MINVYLWANAVLYVVLAAWCTLSPWSTASAIGLQSLSNGGRTEYLVIYGGMQLGLGLFFGWSALAGQQRAGVMLALLIYVPLVLYRSITLAKYWPVSRVTLGTAALEILLLLGALLVYLRSPLLRNT